MPPITTTKISHLWYCVRFYFINDCMYELLCGNMNTYAGSFWTAEGRREYQIP